LRLTASRRVGAKSRRVNPFETHEASTTHPDHADLGCSLRAARLFSDVFQSPDRCASHAPCVPSSWTFGSVVVYLSRPRIQLLLSPIIKTVPCGGQTCVAGFRPTNSSSDSPPPVNGRCCRRHPSSSSAFLPIPFAAVARLLPCMQPIIYRAVG
jgi:hypothetical protein